MLTLLLLCSSNCFLVVLVLCTVLLVGALILNGCLWKCFFRFVKFIKILCMVFRCSAMRVKSISITLNKEF